MKIGFFGNTNNYPLMLVEAVRELGHEVLLIINSSEMLHRPESYSARYEAKYPDWIMDGSYLSEWDYISLPPDAAPVLDALSNCDALILNEKGPSLLPLINRPAVAVLTGSDLTCYASNHLMEVRTAEWGNAFRFTEKGQLQLQQMRDFVERQRAGIRSALAVSYFPKGTDPEGDAILGEIGVPDEKRITLFMTDVDRQKFVPPPHNHPLRVFGMARLTWKLPMASGASVLDYKGSDVLIRGLGVFFRETKIPLEIRLVRKGWHVRETEELIAQEGLSEMVVWLDEMPLHRFREEVARCDIAVDQLGSSLPAMATLDALAIGRPVIANARLEVPSPWSSPESPICQAETPEEVAFQLTRLQDPEERERVGRAGRKFAEKHFRPRRGAEAVLQILQRTVRGKGDDETTYACILERFSERGREIARLRATLDSICRVLGSAKTLRRQVLQPPFVQEGSLMWRPRALRIPGGDSVDLPQRSTLLLFEDDELLGPPHSLHDDIQTVGGGRYSHWHDQLYFSTSDGTDPNINGRRYTVVYFA
ncbi:hypothetical protein D6779_12105 [Candidatus Parcubacteria bacterium]|nr:MAG: hypothetical protein D6779_12105 [Candidatus Parcubacteria bacterium]